MEDWQVNHNEWLATTNARRKLDGFSPVSDKHIEEHKQFDQDNALKAEAALRQLQSYPHIVELLGRVFKSHREKSLSP